MKIKQLSLNLDLLTLQIPVLEFGQGPKKIGLVCAVHGVETTGLFLVKKLLENQNQLKNQIKVIAGANPSGLMTKSRFCGLDLEVDLKDPNRSFNNKADGCVQERLNALVLDEVSDCDFVIDIHNFSNIGKPFPILSLEGIDQVSQQTLTALEIFEPEVVFLSNQKQAEKRGFSNTFNEALNKKGIDNLCLEMPAIDLFADQELDGLTQKLIAMVNSVGGVKKTPLFAKVTGDKQKVIKLSSKFINTEIVRSEKAGIFMPTVFPVTKIKKGDVLGALFSFFDGQEIEIKSPKDGLLIVIHRKDFVRVGEFLLEVGNKVDFTLGKSQIAKKS